MTTQPEALRLADIIGGNCAAELRRLHSVNAELLGLLKAMLALHDNPMPGAGLWGGFLYDAATTRAAARAAIAKAEEVKP